MSESSNDYHGNKVAFTGSYFAYIPVDRIVNMEPGMNRSVSIKDIVVNTFKEYGGDQVGRLAAAFSYFTFVSIFPLLLVLIALVGWAVSAGIGPAIEAQQFVMDSISQNLPAAEGIFADTFDQMQEQAGTIGLVGLLTGLWAASNIFAQLEQSLNIIFDVSPRKVGFVEQMKKRGGAALIVVLLAVLMIGSLVFGAIVGAAGDIARTFPGGAVAAYLLNIGVSLIFTGGIFALLFRYLPDKPVSWKGAFIGGLFTAVAWQFGRELLTWWVTRPDASVAAGTVVGGVLAFLILVYYAAQILMMGAQLTATYDEMVNPDLVRHRTEVDSPLVGPGRAPVAQSGKTVVLGQDVAGTRATPPRTPPPATRKARKGKR
jgi:membrane protein